MKDLKTYQSLARQKQGEHRKVLARLKKKPPRNIDYLAEEIHEEVFEKIDCLSCANCCKTTSPLFVEKDKERISKHLRMKVADFESRYLKIDDEGDWVLQSAPCPFLDLSDNMCSIYDVRPKACSEYPHTNRKKIYQINHLTIQNTLICPAAYEFVEKLKNSF